MKLKINLLPSKVGEIHKANRIIELIQLGTKILAGVVGGAMLLAFGLFFLANFQLGNLGRQVGDLSSQIGQEQNVEKDYRRFKDVLTLIKRVINDRRDFESSLNDLYGLLPSGVTVEGVSFGDKTMTFDGKSDDVQGMAATLAKFQSGAKPKRFGDIEVNKVLRDVDGSYSFTLQITLNEG